MKRRDFIGSCLGLSTLVKPDLSAALPLNEINRWDGGIGIFTLGLGTGNLHRLSNHEAESLIIKAVELGINYFDTAAAYGNGISEIVLGKTLSSQRNRILFTSKTLQRKKEPALKDLETSLHRLGTDHLDVWMIHDLRNDYEWDTITSSEGAIQAAYTAKSQGLTRFIGLSAHRNPDLVLRALKEFPLDVVMIPVGSFSQQNREFVKRVLPEATRRGITVVGMKLSDSTLKTTSQEEMIRESLSHALNLPLSGIVMGCENQEQLIQNVKTVRLLARRDRSTV